MAEQFVIYSLLTVSVTYIIFYLKRYLSSGELPEKCRNCALVKGRRSNRS